MVDCLAKNMSCNPGDCICKDYINPDWENNNWNIVGGEVVIMLKMEWIPVENEPKEDDEYLVLMPTADPDKPLRQLAWWHSKEKIWENKMLVFGFEITHYLVIPKYVE